MAEKCEPGGTLSPGHWSNQKSHCYANFMLMRTFIAFIAVFAAGAVMAQAYKWVDEDGVVHFSDTPVEGAERIDLPTDGRPRRQVTPTVTSSAAAATATSAATAEEPPTVFKYDSIEIVAPAPEETLWNIEGVLNVALRVSPALRSGDRVRVFFDGEERLVTSSSSFQIQEVWRGVHNIQAEIIDSTGKLMARSLPNRFYVQQNSIAGPR
jgi:hypothetical protein